MQCYGIQHLLHCVGLLQTRDLAWRNNLELENVSTAARSRLSLCLSLFSANTWAMAILTSCACHELRGNGEGEGEGLQLPGGAESVGGRNQSYKGLDGRIQHNMQRRGKIDRKRPGRRRRLRGGTERGLTCLQAGSVKQRVPGTESDRGSSIISHGRDGGEQDPRLKDALMCGWESELHLLHSWHAGQRRAGLKNTEGMSEEWIKTWVAAVEEQRGGNRQIEDRLSRQAEKKRERDEYTVEYSERWLQPSDVWSGAGRVMKGPTGITARASGEVYHMRLWS